MEEDIKTELAIMSRHSRIQVSVLVQYLGESKAAELTILQETFEDDEVDLCRVCGAFRLMPRCRKPVHPGLPTRPKICRICLVYLVAGCLANDGEV